jgi:hypothetical protein
MSNILEYILKLNDSMSAKLKAVGAQSDTTKHKLEGLRKESSGTFNGIGNMLGAAGIGFGMFQIVNMMEQGVEKVHALHLAEAALKNTMMNMGTYGAESFDKIVEGSKKMASGILYSTADIVGLQSQLRMVGGIGESEMQRMTKASADMATKLGMGLDEAGNALAKAVNNPEMMTRLAMRIKIDPEAVKHMQDLAKGGNEAAARLELLNIVEQKVGGAAKAAFDADPLARYNKVVNSMKLSLGESAIKIQATLAPALIILADKFKNLATGIADVVSWMAAHKKTTAAIVITWSLLEIAINAVAIKTKFLAMWQSILATKTALLTAAQWLLDIAMNANPIGLIIIGIAALIALITVIIVKYNEWGAALTLFLGPIGFVIDAIMSFRRNWDSIVEAFKSDGIIGGIKRIGIVLLDALLYPVQQLLELLSKIPGLGDIAGGGAAKIQDIRNKLGLISPEKTVLDKIAVATQPGKSDPLGKITPDKKAKATNDAISSGGTRNTSIIINLKNMVETIRFDGNLADNRGDLEKEVTSIMARVLGMAQATS